jgi:uncharacterized protein (DUF1684 family)
MSPSCHGALHAFPATERTRFTKYSRRPNQAGHNRLLSFALHGQNLGLKVETVRTGGFFIVFRHLTSGKETYPASRFIDTTPPKDTPGGKLVDLDFNKAYNPPCTYNPYTTCPLPLPGNRLKIAIPAGEALQARPSVA